MENLPVIQTFNNEQFGEIRWLLIKGIPYFVGKDIADALGYTNPGKALRDHVDDEDKMVNKSFTLGQGSAPVLINESGMYSLILSSKLPTAKKFKHWVTSEVLPSIRKTGSYSIQNESNLNTPATDAFKDVRTLATEIQEEFIGVQRGIAISQAIDIAEKVHDVPLQSLKSLLPPAEHETGYLNPTRIGEKLGGVPAKVVNKMLAKKGLQYKDGKDWRLTENGKFYGEEMPYTRNNHSGYQIRWNEDVLKVAKCQEE